MNEVEVSHQEVARTHTRDDQGWLPDAQLCQVARHFLAQREAQGFHGRCQDPVLIAQLADDILAARERAQ